MDGGGKEGLNLSVFVHVGGRFGRSFVADFCLLSDWLFTVLDNQLATALCHSLSVDSIARFKECCFAVRCFFVLGDGGGCRSVLRGSSSRVLWVEKGSRRRGSIRIEIWVKSGPSLKELVGGGGVGVIVEVCCGEEQRTRADTTRHSQMAPLVAAWPCWECKGDN